MDAGARPMPGAIAEGGSGDVESIAMAINYSAEQRDIVRPTGGVRHYAAFRAHCRSTTIFAALTLLRNWQVRRIPAIYPAHSPGREPRLFLRILTRTAQTMSRWMLIPFFNLPHYPTLEHALPGTAAIQRRARGNMPHCPGSPRTHNVPPSQQETGGEN
jgi:hypothetical protein